MNPERNNFTIYFSKMTRFKYRCLGNPFTIEDGNGRTIYFNDGATEYTTAENPTLDELVENLKKEEEYIIENH